MRIAINCRSILLDQRTGIGRYTYHLLDCLGAIDQTNEYILHAPKGLFDLKRRLPDFSRYKNFKGCIDYWQRGTSGSGIYHLPSPGPIGPYSGKLIATIHDLVHRTYPQSQTSKSTELTEKYIQDITARADGIICISENTRRDLHDLFGMPPEKTCVVHNGVDHRIFYPFNPQERAEAAAKLKELGISKPYVLYVGTIEPRKNLTGLLESYAKLKSKKVFQGQCVVAGMQGWMVENVEGALKKLDIQSDVIFTGYVSDAQLRMLYNMSEVFVFPSFYEGFGFPILEAFCCGAAVVTSKTSSCGEIAGDAAMLVDPKDDQALVQAIETALTDKAMNGQLRQAGLKRAQGFSFERMAKETLEVYQRLYDQ